MTSTPPIPINLPDNWTHNWKKSYSHTHKKIFWCNKSIESPIENTIWYNPTQFKSEEDFNNRKTVSFKKHDFIKCKQCNSIYNTIFDSETMYCKKCISYICAINTHMWSKITSLNQVELLKKQLLHKRAQEAVALQQATALQQAALQQAALQQAAQQQAAQQQAAQQQQQQQQAAQQQAAQQQQQQHVVALEDERNNRKRRKVDNEELRLSRIEIKKLTNTNIKANEKINQLTIELTKYKRQISLNENLSSIDDVVTHLAQNQNKRVSCLL